jgi:hypothetical protein
MLNAINTLLSTIFEIFRLLFRGRIWLPLVLFALVQGIVLYAHHRFFLPPFSGVMSAWLGLFPDAIQNGFVHYPQQYILFPTVFSWAKLLLGFLLEGSLLYLVAAYFAQAMGLSGTPSAPSFVTRWLKSIFFWLLLNGLNIIVSVVLPNLISSQLDGPRRIFLFTFVVLPFLYVLIISPLFYAIPSLAVYGDSVGGALKRSWLLFIAKPISTFFLSLYVLFIPALLGAVISTPSRLVDQFRPEVIFWLFVVVLFVEMVAAFFWMGTAVRFLTLPRR